MAKKLRKLVFRPSDDQNFEFNVNREELFLANGKSTNLHGLSRADTGDFLAAVSPEYQLTTHKNADDFVQKFLTSQNISYEIGKTAVANNGNRFFREYRFPGMAFNPSEGSGVGTALDNSGKIDMYIPTIIARNSYNRSTTLDFTYGGFRYICLNGMIVGTVDQRISIKHIKSPDFNMIGDIFLDRIEATVNGFKRLYTNLNSKPASVYSDLLFAEVLTSRMVQVAEQMSNGLIVPQYEDDTIVGLEVNPALSAYALYNIATAIATHEVRKYHRSLELQNKIAKVFAAA